MKTKHLLLLAVLIATMATACNSMKDCTGVKHVRLANGVRI